MNYENEFCRKVYDHHEVLKNEIAATLLESMTRANASSDLIKSVVFTAQAVVDGSSHKMVSDFQRTFTKISQNK